MFPKLYKSNETNFVHNGLGLLSDAIYAVATEELNGMFELKIEYDSQGFLVDQIKEEMIIKAKANDKQDEQLFRIYSITKNHENDNLIIDAQHITYDLAGNFVEEMVANNLTKKQVMELIGSSTVLPHPFNITSSNTTTISSTKLYRTNPLQMIAGMDGSVLQIWGGQIERDNFNLIMHDRRGHDDGVTVTYEKNITGLTAEFDIGSLVTRIFPFVYIEATDDSPERLITVNGKYIDSPLINNYEKVYIEPIDYSHDDRIDIQDKTDAQIRQQLESVASTYFEETGNDKVKASMDVAFMHLWETEEYKHVAPLELVGMGDTVTINHSRLKVDATAIVNYIKYDCIAHVNEEVRLGNVKVGLTDSINKINTIERKVEQAESNANRAIISANGKNTTYYGPDEPSSAQKGDLWFKVIDGQYHKTYRFDGIEWQLIIDMDSQEAKAEAQQAKDDAQDAVDRANKASGDAQNAIDQAQESFDKAQEAIGKSDDAFEKATEAFEDVESLSEIVDETTGEVSTIKHDVIGLQTSVSDNAGNISNLTQIAEGLQTRVSDAEGNISTLEQTATGLQSTVSEVRADLDGLEIGGRNLLLNTSDEKTVTRNFDHDISKPLEAGVITYSVWLKANRDTTVRVYINDDTGQKRTGVTFASDVPVTTSYQKYTFTANLSKFEGDSTDSIRMRVYGSEGDLLTGKEAKLEVGNKATDWTPAPEDIQSQFSTINQTVDSISTRIEDNEGNISTLTQTAQGLQNRVSDAEGNISNVTQLANTLQTDLRDAEGNINTLTETASSMQRTISDLEGDVESQITQLSDAINLRVEKGDVLSQLNIEAGRTLIDTDKLILDANTTVVTGSFRVNNANITSLDAGKLTVGDLVGHSLVGGSVIGGYIEQQSGSRRLEMTNGRIQSFYNNQLAMEFGQYSLDFYSPSGARIGSFGPTTMTGSESRGLTLSVDQDYISISHLIDLAYYPAFRTRKDGTNSTMVAGAYATGTQSTRATIYANSRIAIESARATNQASIQLEHTSTRNDITAYYGSANRPNSAFSVRYNTSPTSSVEMLRASQSRVTIASPLYIGNEHSRIDTTANTVSLRYDQNNRIRIFDTGRVDILAGNNVRHTFAADGGKTGGTIFLDDKNWGMSPIDSPQSLIEYVMFNVVVENKTIIFVDEKFLKAVDDYAVFSSRNFDIEKDGNKVYVRGNGITDLRFVGKRHDYADQFWVDMDKENEGEKVA